MMEWKTFKLGEIAEITSSKRIFLSDYVPAGVPFFRSKEVIERSAGREISTELFITEEKFQSIKDKFGVPEEGDVLLTSVGTIGIPYRVRNGDRFYFKDGNLTWFRNFRHFADSRFLVYWLRSKIGKASIENAKIGSTQQALTIIALKNISIELPPIEHQQQIVRILKSLDDKIELNRRMNATLEAMARALFKAWFVDFEPVHANLENRPSTSASPEIAKLFPSDLENGIPIGWRVGTLSDIATNYKRNIDPREIDSDTPYVGLEHIPRGSLALTEWGTASKAESTKSEFRPNDILFGKLRPYFHKVVLAPVDGICSTDVLVIRPKHDYHFGQTAIQFSGEALIQYATQLSNGAKMPRTSWSDLAKFKTVIPSQQVSVEYTRFIDSIAGRSLMNIGESKTLEKLRDSLLPRLISGRIRIKGPLGNEQLI